MKAARPGLALGLLAGASAGAGLGWWLLGQPELRLIVAAVPIAEGDVITVSMLDVREVPARFMSKRKLGVTHVAGVLGQRAPQPLRAGDFIDPTHFAADGAADTCVLDARALAGPADAQTVATRVFLERLSLESSPVAAPAEPTR